MEELIFKYFPNLTVEQKDRFTRLYPLYKEWNNAINVISRKDIDNIYLHHILHSLAIARYINIPHGARVLDVGTGGGFPGIPLSIFFPDVHFTLCDSIQKKIKVVTEVKEALSLNNVYPFRGRAEEINGKFDFVVSRAVTELTNFLPWVWNKIEQANPNNPHRGVIYLKGGDLNTEINEACKKNGINMNLVFTKNISDWFNEPFFEEKKIVHIIK